jgi:hypothetical protein
MTPLSGSAWWAVTDASTAAATWGGVDDLALQTPDSATAAPDQATYVAPTGSQGQAAMQAAVANMTSQSDGTLLPNSGGGAVNGVEPYALTYVEYAIAPAQPLVNPDCTANASAQTALSQWLSFLIGDGQNHLAAGMAPLPSSLVTQAQANIAKVGKAASSCTPSNSTASTPSPGAGSSATGSGSGTGLGSGSVSSFASPLSTTGEAAAGSTTSASKAGSGSPAKGSTRPSALSLSAFESVSPAGWALPLLGVLVLVLLLPGLVLLASGRSLSEIAGGLRSANPSPPGVQPSGPDVASAPDVGAAP